MPRWNTVRNTLAPLDIAISEESGKIALFCFSGLHSVVMYRSTPNGNLLGSPFYGKRDLRLEVELRKLTRKSQRM
jgi:hypothetical protein